MSAILRRPSDLRSRRSWKASTSSSLMRRCRLSGRSSDGMSPRSRSLATKGRDRPSSSAASVGVSMTSAGMVMTDRPAARLFATLTTRQQRRRQADLRTVASAQYQLPRCCETLGERERYPPDMVGRRVSDGDGPGRYGARRSARSVADQYELVLQDILFAAIGDRLLQGGRRHGHRRSGLMAVPAMVSCKRTPPRCSLGRLW
jgi:hypothetical protein